MEHAASEKLAIDCGEPMINRIPSIGISLAILAAGLLACSDQSLLSGPRDGAREQPPSRITPIDPDAQRPTHGGLNPNFLFVVFPGDTTTDPCFAGEYCGVQGRAAGGQAVIFCPNGPGTCPDHRYRWSIETPPPNTTTTFDPEVTVNEQPTTFLIQTDSATVPGTYQPVIVSTLDDIVAVATTAAAYTADTIPVRVRCNVKFKSCPQIEIVDLTKGPDSVISAPRPKQSTLIGKHIKLGLRWKAGTGTGSYSLVQTPVPPPPYQWSLSGTIVKSYDITTGRLDSLRLADRQADTVSYYYARAAATNTVYAVATLMRDDNRQVSFPEATASFNAQGPSAVTMVSTTTPRGVTVGPTLADSSRIWLGLGDPTTVATAGIQFRFLATAPAGDSGYVAGTQLVNSQTSSIPPSSTPTTGGAYWLDGCSLYANFRSASGGQYVWQSDDSPRAELLATDSIVSAADSLRMYFMYRPRGQESIWVPIGKVQWFWRGTASKTGQPANNHGWTGPTAAAYSANPAGASSSEFPEWPQVFLPDSACPGLPAN